MIQIKNLERNMENRSSMLQNAGPVYMFTNENIPETLILAGGARGKKILTVAASGDQAFEAYAMGASHVDTFDFNIMQQTVMNLKTTAIHHLSHDEFVRIFNRGSFCFNNEITAKLWPVLTDAERNFIEIYKQNKFLISYLDGHNIKQSNWFNPDTYQDLKQKLPTQIPFIHCDIGQLPHQVTAKYDIILLSNIFTYAYPAQNRTALMQMYNEVLKPLAENNLNDNGYICAQYNWSFEYAFPVTIEWTNILNSINAEIQSDGNQFDLYYVDSYRPSSFTDAVTVMKKNRIR